MDRSGGVLNADDLGFTAQTVMGKDFDPNSEVQRHQFCSRTTTVPYAYSRNSPH